MRTTICGLLVIMAGCALWAQGDGEPVGYRLFLDAKTSNKAVALDGPAPAALSVSALSALPTLRLMREDEAKLVEQPTFQFAAFTPFIDAPKSMATLNVPVLPATLHLMLEPTVKDFGADVAGHTGTALLIPDGISWLSTVRVDKLSQTAEIQLPILTLSEWTEKTEKSR